MSELKRISPMLDDFDIGGSVSEHAGVFCYPAMRKGTDDRYIIKTVSIPASQTQLDALLLTGAFPDAAAALTYFKDLADRTVDELEILKQLSQAEGFLPYDNWQVEAKGDGIGFDVYMVSPYKRTLRKLMNKQPMTHLGAINLGLDICTALAVCRRLGYLYVDLKPNNIYVIDDNQFRIGDLGFIPLDSLSYTSLPDKYRSEYTAPELQDPFATLTPTLDVYALGMILYQIYNGSELPIADNDGNIPAPANADYEMAEIILKAIAANPADRWQDPVEMGQTLVSYMQRNGANDVPILPPVVVDTDTSALDEVADLEDAELAQILEEADGLLEDQMHIEDLIDAEDEAAAIETDENIDELPADEPNTDITAVIENTPTADDADNTDVAPVVVPVAEEAVLSTDALADEILPENNTNDVVYEEVSDDLMAMLAQADELVAHPVPDPVVAPDPVEIPNPDPIVDGTAVSDEEDTPADTTETSEDDSQNLQSSMFTETVVIPDGVSSGLSDSVAAEEVPVGKASQKTESNAKPVKKKKSAAQIVLNILLIVLFIAVIVLGFFYYKNIYLLPIDSLTISGNESTLVVELDSNIDETLLSVVCSDSHGNQRSAPVVNGTATFSGLSPDTAYNVQILVTGFHRLTGETAASYSTPAQTNIVQFNAVTGTEDGSVILGFTVEGPDNGNWHVTYSASGEEEKTIELLSHMATITGLTVGKEYTFRLVPGDNMYVTGQTEIAFTASELLYAEDVTIVSCIDNNLTVTWNAPDEGTITEWTVRCYDDASYNQTFITAESTAVFENIDTTKNYTVEVTAAGMSVSQRAYMTANAITVSNFQVDPGTNKMTLTWEANQAVPDGGWVLLYNVDGSPIQCSLTCDENRAVISPIVPDAEYVFTLQQTNGDAVLTAPMTYHTDKAKDFSGYGMIRSSMTFKLCKRPNDSNWDHSDLNDSDYTSTFKVGEDISFVGQLHDKYGISDDKIITTYVFRDENNKVVSFSYTESTWEAMWRKYYGEFDIPQAPAEPGEYSLSIYFNGKLVTKKSVTIEE